MIEISVWEEDRRPEKEAKNKGLERNGKEVSWLEEEKRRQRPGKKREER